MAALSALNYTTKEREDFNMLKQLSIYAENKKGVMQNITGILKDEDINILGSVTNDSAEYGIVRMVVSDPEKAKDLEENLAAIPDCAKSAVNGCLGTLTNLSYNVDENGNISVAISGTNDPDGKIAKENAERKAKENREKEEKVKEKRAAKKAEEEKAAKKRAEKSAEGKETGDYTLSVTGNDVKSMTQSLVAESVSISAPDRSSFDIKA